MAGEKFVKYKNGHYMTSDEGGGSSTFADLEDVNFSNLSDGQVPKYNATTQKWENASESGGTVTDVLVDGQSVVNPQTGEAEITMPTPPSVPVTDVKVNGQSVVDSNKSAQITSYKEVTRAQYEALPDSKLTDGILYCIKDESRGADSFPPLIYSDEEREVGVWRDGKPLYQKTIDAGVLTKDTNWHDVACGIENVDKFVDIFGVAFGEDENFYTLPNYRPGRSEGIITNCYIDSNSVPQFSYINNLLSNAHAWITIKYTKATDVAGSGIWNTDGSFAHHYSTQEKVVGTWVDGSTIYEKVISGLSYTASNQWNSTGITIQGLDKVISCKFAQVQNSELLSFVDYFICKNDGNGNVQAWGTSSNVYTYQVALIQYTKSTT